jgi:nucleotide-binding universal stress UspA family protein
MLPLHTILVPTDFSVRSKNALEVACSLAQDYHAHLIVLHVTPWRSIALVQGHMSFDSKLIHRDAQETLERLAVVPPTVHIERRVRAGNPVTQIVQQAQEVGADLIVMGTHGRSGLTRILLGSVTEKVMRRAPCPVLAVRMPVSAPPTVPTEVAAVSATR